MKIAIIGARGIGEVIIKKIINYGVEDLSILCSTITSTKKQANYLNKKYKSNIKALKGEGDLFQKDLFDAVVIASPNNTHSHFIEQSLQYNFNIFCEKPLIWNKKNNIKDIDNFLKYIQKKHKRLLFCNTPNKYFIKSIIKKYPKLTKNIKEFTFVFHTKGNNIHENIAIDLLPHGYSLISELLGNQKTLNYKKISTKYKYLCSFTYGVCKVNFEFIETPKIKKKLIFKINNNSFKRIQTGTGDSYKVFLKNKNDKVRIEDPYNSHINLFLNYLYQKKQAQEEYRLSINGMNWLKNILLSKI